MTLTRNISNHNFYAFLWHAGFLAFAQNFMDVDTVIPAMIIELILVLQVQGISCLLSFLLPAVGLLNNLVSVSSLSYLC
jgi:hypothetical protein